MDCIKRPVREVLSLMVGAPPAKVPPAVAGNEADDIPGAVAAELGVGRSTVCWSLTRAQLVT